MGIYIKHIDLGEILKRNKVKNEIDVAIVKDTMVTFHQGGIKNDEGYNTPNVLIS
jgi:hypothetical protein